MSFLLSSALKEVRRRLADPMALLLWLGIPLILGGLLGMLAGRGGASPKPHLLVADLDESLISRLLVTALSQSDSGGFLQVEKTDVAQGRARMGRGEASALLIVPKGFGNAFLREERTELALVTNPAQQIMPQIVDEGLEILVEAGFYLQRLFGEELRAVAAGPADGGSFFPDATVANLGAGINRRLRGLSTTLLPPVISLETSFEKAATPPSVSFGTLFFPGILFMAIMFAAQGMSDDVWEEKAQGTLRRIAAAPHGMGVFLGGKILAGAALIGAVSLAGMLIGLVAFDIPPARIAMALLWSTLVGTALFCFFSLLQLLGSSRRGASLLANLILFPLIMLGGSFFPFENMPVWMAAAGRWTPNGLGVLQLKTMLFGLPQAEQILTAAAAIALPAIAAVYLSVRRLRGRFSAF